MTQAFKPEFTRRGFAETGAVVLASSLVNQLAHSEQSRLNIGIVVYPPMDQIDFTGPFEVFSRLPNATVHVLWKERGPVPDYKGLVLTPETALSEAPPLDILQVPGAYGQEALMDDEIVLSFIRKRMESGRYVYSVYTGALICGAAEILDIGGPPRIGRLLACSAISAPRQSTLA
jgi:hypothetical protein